MKVVLLLTLAPPLITVIYHLVATQQEKRIIVFDDKIRVEYKFPNKTIEFFFKQIHAVRFNKLSTVNACCIYYDEVDQQVERRNVTVYSLTLSDWKNLANKYGFRFYAGHNIRNSTKKREEELYWIGKNAANRTIRFKKEKWLDFAVVYKQLKYVSEDELINVDELEVAVQYELLTSYGPKLLEFRNGEIFVMYERGKKPIEIIHIANQLDGEYLRLDPKNEITSEQFRR